MKHLKRIFENTSNELPDDIQDAILGIEDEFGVPEITIRSNNNVTYYKLKWKLMIHNADSLDSFNENLEKLFRIRHDLLSIKGRLTQKYETKLSCQEGLMVFVISTKTPFDYSFVNDIDHTKKVIYLNKSEIEKFFNTRIKLKDLRVSLDRSSSSSYRGNYFLSITTAWFRSEKGEEYFEEFIDLIKDQIPGLTFKDFEVKDYTLEIYFMKKIRDYDNDPKSYYRAILQ
jgi:hypothetical protein